jgi:hypothetical protein
MAAPIGIKQELPSSDPSNIVDLLTPEKEIHFKPRKESIVELSKITNKEEDMLKHLTIKLRSPTEVVQKLEENNKSQGFNFDFLEESSNSHVQKMIEDVINDLKGMRDDSK